MDDAAERFMGKITEITGKTREEITRLYEQSALVKHSEIRALFMDKLLLSYGFANTLAHVIAGTDGASLAEGKDMQTLLDEIYSGKKAPFRPIHDLIMSEIEEFGPFETEPKKGYISLKRKRQFAMIGPKTNTRMEIGINLKDHAGTARLLEQPKGSMCRLIVNVESMDDVDHELIGWIKAGYEQAQ